MENDSDAALWYEIRDLFLGRNFRIQNVSLALAKARKCAHPNAEWLCRIFKDVDVSDGVGANVALMRHANLHENDFQAKTFLALLQQPIDHFGVHFCALNGDAFAMAALLGTYHHFASEDEKLNFARKSADLGERDGFFCLAARLEFGRVPTKPEKLMSLYLKAAKLGHVGALNALGNMLSDADVARWHYWGLAAQKGSCANFLRWFPWQLSLVRSGRANVVFAIGKVLHKHYHFGKSTLFGARASDEQMAAAAQAISFYQRQIQAAKDAVNQWTLVASRFRVVKDVRKIVAQLIWNDREDAKYNV